MANSVPDFPWPHHPAMLRIIVTDAKSTVFDVPELSDAEIQDYILDHEQRVYASEQIQADRAYTDYGVQNGIEATS